jgi:predicted MFS family arabinose efflux permease
MKRIGNLYKSAYSGLSPATWWLSLVMLVNRSGTMVVPFMTLYLTEARHYTIAKAGMVMATFGLGAICGGFLGGKLTDKFGFYNVQLSALLCGGILFILLGQMTSLGAIMACTFLLALLNESFRPANATAIAQYSKEENRTRSYSLNRLSINLGWAVGGALGGLIASRNYHMLFWIDGLTNIFAALLLRSVLSPAKNPQTPSAKDTTVTRTSTPYSDTPYLFFTVLTILFGSSFYQIFSTLPVYYKQQLHLSPSFIGGVMAFNGLLITLFEMAVVFTLEQKNKHLYFVTIGTLIVGASFVVFNVLPGEGSLALLSTVLVTAGEILSFPFMNSYWVSRTDMGNRGQYAGLYTAAWSIAQVLGPLAGTQIVQQFGFNVLWWGVGGLSVATAFGFRWLEAISVKHKKTPH